MENQNKKAIYKKWWFWVIIVVIIIVIFGSQDGTNETSKTTLEAGTNVANETTNTQAKEAKKYNVGEIYEDNNIAVKYVSIDENFTAYSEYATIKDGYKIIKAEFEAENLGSTDEYFSAYDFNCYADGYDCENFWSVDDSSFSSTLSTGKKTKGNVYFEVPQDAESISIEYTLNSFTGDKVEFIVK